MRQARLALAAACLLATAACGTQGSSTGGEVLRFLTTSLPAAATGEPYNQEVVLTSGTRPYTLRVAKGTLPPGLGLQGRSITGTPTEAKQYSFTLEASDANLSIVQREFTLGVQATPPKTLAWTLPPTEVSGEIKVPMVLRSPRGVSGFKASVPLPEGVQFVRVDPGDGRPLLLTKLDANVLRVDGAFRDPPKNNKDLTAFTLVLKSDKAVKLGGTVGFDLRAGGKSLATAALARPTATPAGTTPTGTTPSGTPGTTPAAPTTTPAAPTTPAPGGTPAAPTTPETPTQQPTTPENPTGGNGGGK